MKKETLIEIILANTGGLFIAVGLCMLGIVEWNMHDTGFVLLGLGALSLIAILPVYWHNHKTLKIKPKKILIRVVAFILALVIGIGLGQIIAKQNIILGVTIWGIGLIASILSYPIYQYHKKDKLKLLKTTLGTVGSILLTIGMSMTFLKIENLIFLGTAIGLSGVVLLIFFVYLNKKNNAEFYTVDLRFIILVILELIGGFLTVYGIITVYHTDALVGTGNSDFTVGLITCCIGFYMCAFVLPTYIFLKTNNIFEKELKVSLVSKENNYPMRIIVLLFFVYGVIGWLIEFVFYGITNGIFVNRGFLHLPILPIYGFGGALATIIFRKKQNNVFIKSAIILSTLEYITSWIMEKMFNLRWWDYTENPLNINGRVCLLNSLMFGLGGYVIAKFISPYINFKLGNRNVKIMNIVNVALVIVVLTDFIYTLRNPNTGIGITIL